MAVVMLGMGKRDATLPVLAVIVADESVYFTDVTGWLRLRGGLANLAALTAVVVSLWDLHRYGRESQLLAIANLLVYLQFIMLFQRKKARTYWLLLLINLQLVAVAAALNSELIFGVLLLGYLVLAIVSLSLLFVHLEAKRRLTLVAAPSPVSETPRFPRRWPLSLENEVLPQPLPKQPLRKLLGWSFVRRTAGLVAGTLGLAAIIFTFVPRLSRAERGTVVLVASEASETGATPEVKLGAGGPLRENPEGVMRVRFFDAATDRPYPVDGDPLFRGYVLTRYANGTWQQEPLSNPQPIHPAPLERFGRLDGLVREEIIMEPFYTNVLFCVYPIHGLLAGEDLQFDTFRRNLLRERNQQGRRFTYSLLTSGFDQGRPARLMPSFLRVDMIDVLRRELTSVPPAARDTVTRLAEEVVADLPAEARFERAVALQRYFVDSKLFRYTLNRPRWHGSGDPTADFLTRYREGHCEYFASALTMMLRSQDIPARMVVGYKGGEWNSLGGFYQVRQLHAHAWVEAYLPPQSLPQELDRESAHWIAGAWLVLDPTPSSAPSSMVTASWLSFPTIRQFTDYLQFVWSGYVMGMDQRRQKRNVYDPMVQTSMLLAKNLFNGKFWLSIGRRAWGFFSDRKRFSWPEGLLGMAITALLVALWRLVRFSYGAAGRWIRRGHRAVTRRRAEVEFYRRLEAILAHARLARSVGQTQREFAGRVQAMLQAAGPTARAVADVPPRVVEAFYRVRFGGRHLDKRQTEAVEHALDRLEAVLANAAPRDGRQP